MLPGSLVHQLEGVAKDVDMGSRVVGRCMCKGTENRCEFSPEDSAGFFEAPRIDVNMFASRGVIQSSAYKCLTRSPI